MLYFMQLAAVVVGTAVPIVLYPPTLLQVMVVLTHPSYTLRPVRLTLGQAAAVGVVPVTSPMGAAALVL